MITSSGAISHKDILDEVGLSTATNSLYQEIRTFNGIRQFKVNGVWQNCNMCSQYLPQDVAPYAIKDWYSYKHNTNSVTGVTITGDSTVDKAQTVTYTATLSGEITAGSVITWYKFDNGVWSSALGTGSTISITWTRPAYGVVRASVYSPCSQTTIIQNLPITWNCVPITNIAVWGDSNIVRGTTYTYNMTVETGSNDTDLSVRWQGSGGFTILSTGLAWDSTNLEWYSYCNVHANYGTGTFWLKAFAKNFCTSTEVEQIKEIIVTEPVTSVGSDEITVTICKQCPPGEAGTCKSVYRAANAFYASTKSEANTIRNTDMQNEVNNDNTMSCINGDVGNDQQSSWFQKQCSSGYTGTYHEYVVFMNTYFASTKAAANTLALNDISNNGQNYVNNLPEASCSSNGGGCVVPNLCSNAININNNGWNRYVQNNTTVAISLSCVSGNNLTYSWKINGSVVSSASSFNYSFNFGTNYPDKFNNYFTVEITISNGCGSITKSAQIYLERYYNTAQSGIFYKDNCPQGTPNPYTHTISAGLYMGTTQGEADTLALSVVNSTGQSAANTYGSCSYTPTDPCLVLNIKTLVITNISVIGNYPDYHSKQYSINMNNYETNRLVEFYFLSYKIGESSPCFVSDETTVISTSGSMDFLATTYDEPIGSGCFFKSVKGRNVIHNPTTGESCYGPWSNEYIIS